MIMLELYDIETGYGAGQVLFGVSLAVTAGACVSLMGRNGMGKTTTVRTIMGQLPLRGGSIDRFGDATPGRESFELARAGIGLVPEGRQIFSNLTVVENLSTFHRPARDGETLWTMDTVLDLFPRLRERLGHAGNNLSGGEQQRVAIARAFAREPAVLFADEPTGNLDTRTGERIVDLLFELNARASTTLVLVTHDERLAQRCDRRFSMTAGELSVS